MPTLLRIDSSARIEGSHSRALADEVQANWLQAHPDGRVVQRDLVKQPVGQLNNETIIGYYTPKEAMTEALRRATAESDILIAELLAADALLISAPMYNFTVPAVLKAWIDQVVRINRTFCVTEQGDIQGLVTGKQAYITTALGAQFSGTPLISMDFMRPYLQSLLGFIGITEVEIYSVESTTMDEQQFALNKAKSVAAIAERFSPAVA